MKIIVNTKTTCPSCIAVKAFLTERGEEFETVVLDDDAARFAMYDSFGLEGNQRTVPQVVIDGERIGGNEATQKFFAKLDGEALFAKPDITTELEF